MGANIATTTQSNYAKKVPLSWNVDQNPPFPYIRNLRFPPPMQCNFEL